MRTRNAICATLAALGTAGAVATPAGAATVRHFEGNIVAVDRTARTFDIRDHSDGRTFRVRIASGTRYERVVGFAGIRRGIGEIEVTVRRVDGRWRAIQVERPGRDRGDD